MDDAFDQLMADAMADDAEDKKRGRKKEHKGDSVKDAEKDRKSEKTEAKGKAEGKDKEEKKDKKDRKDKKDKKDKKEKKEKKRAKVEEEAAIVPCPPQKKMIEIICNDRLGNKVRVKCLADDTIGNVKKIIAAQSGHRADKIRLQKWYSVSQSGRFFQIVFLFSFLSRCLRFVCFFFSCLFAESQLLQDHVTLSDYEIHDGMSIELHYN